MALSNGRARMFTQTLACPFLLFGLQFLRIRVLYGLIISGLWVDDSWFYLKFRLAGKSL